ncbi:coiled-coil domain-containing protein 82 [Pseudonaja textilis]|uniref:coiled-coil domain-containing protein 82 n=1 Tax=Pseudonaja textilis TaxID=8673 RepID=UPI000EA953AA|nr:coiled-coil domain-containing protein 82 [Pseudonaja textilis]
METNAVTRRYQTRNATAKLAAKSCIDWNETKRYLFRKRQDNDNEIRYSFSSSYSLFSSSSSSSEKDDQDDDYELIYSSSSLSSSSSKKDLKSRLKKDVDGEEEKTSILSKSNSEAGNDADLQKGWSDASSDDLEQENISLGKRKRPQTEVIHVTDESSDSSVPRKMIAKGRRVISEEDLSVVEESPTFPEEKAANRKQERHLKLQELSSRQTQKSGRVNQRDEGSADHALMQRDSHSPLTQEEICVISDEDSMKNFIEEGGDGEEEEELKWDNFQQEDYQHLDRKHHVASHLLEKHIPFVFEVDHYLHFQRVVKAFLINATDDKFLSSLYERKRQTKHAQEMLTSLYYFDQRFIQPYLESLVLGCRWKNRYRTRVDSYSKVSIIPQHSTTRICQACELDRDCKFIVIFSGKEYCHKTLKEDDFMPHDTQRLKVGIVCQRCTQVYHDLKHYKYKLYQECCSAVKEQHIRDEDGEKNLQDEPVEDLVKRVFSHLEENGWIREKYSKLESYQDEVAEFHKFLNNYKRDLSFEQYY